MPEGQAQIDEQPEKTLHELREENLKLHRKAMLTQHGVIPEFIRISELH